MKSQLPRGARYGALLFFALACMQPLAHRLGVTSAGAAGPVIKSGYALGHERCGEAPLAFPKVRIGMRPGYCAGLVASKEDGLVFPRSIVQVPDTRLFVVADMGGWSRGQGPPAAARSRGAEGKRLTVLLAGSTLPHGLAVGIDRRVYASTDQKIFRFDPLAKRPADDGRDDPAGPAGAPRHAVRRNEVAENAHPLKHFVFDKTGRHLREYRRADRQLRRPTPGRGARRARAPIRSPRSGRSRHRRAASFRR